jgi:hypothetical protein
MLRTVWAKIGGHKRLYLIDERYDFVAPVKLYVDHLAALEKSPHTLENAMYLTHFLLLVQHLTSLRVANPFITPN